MKQYTKIINGKTVINTRNRIIIYKDDLQILNPTEEMLFADGWVEYIEPEVVVDELVKARQNKESEIKAYDSSMEVNIFYIQNIPVWLDKATRTGLKLRFEAEISNGKEETTLWYNNVKFPLNLENAMQMLYAIEMYASACYDNTQLHYANVAKLETVEEIESYNHTIGYPEKLFF